MNLSKIEKVVLTNLCYVKEFQYPTEIELKLN